MSQRTSIFVLCVLALVGCSEEPQTVAPPPVGTIGEPVNIIVFFASDSATLGDGDLGQRNRRALDSALWAMPFVFDPRNKGWVCVTGHADAQGPEEFNRWVSRRRADVVSDYLVGMGIPRERVLRRGVGSMQPIIGNLPAGKAEIQNRAVDLRFFGTDPRDSECHPGNVRGR